MLELAGIDLNRIVYFKKATFNFEPGLTYVMGRNKQRHGPGASNGAGKSLLFGVIPNLIHDTHPVITKNGRSVQKQLYSNGGSAGIRFKSNSGADYKYVKSGSKTELFKGNKNIKSRMARDTLRKLIDISEEEFFSTAYIDSSRPNNFMRGTSAERFQFITNLFRLHDMDALRKQFRKELNELRSDANVFDRIKADLDEATNQLAALPADAEAEADRLSRKLEKLTEEQNEVHAQLLRHETWEKYIKKRAEWKQIKLPKATLAQLTTQLKELQEYRAALKQYKKQKQRRTELKEELSSLKIGDTSKHEQMLDMKLKVEHMEEELPEKPEKPEMERDDARRIAKTHATNKLTRLRDVQKNVVRQRQTALDEFDTVLGHDGLEHEGECPTCHSVLSAKAKKQVRATLTQLLEEAEKKLKKIERIREAVQARDAWSEYDRQLEQWREYREAKDKIKDYPFKAIARYEEIKTILDNLEIEKPDPVDHDEELIEKQLEVIERYNQLEKVVVALRCEKPTMTVDAAKERKLELSVRVNKIMQKLPRLQSKAELRRQASKRVKDLTRELNELSARLEDLPVYEMLSDAYSANGIKLLLVKRIAAAIESNLNKYSKQVFSENFAFKIHIDDGKFDIIVSRQTADKGTQVSDVRHLSGAEGRLFIFLQLLSLLPLIPSSRRLNVLILDEPTANMDNPALETFRDVMLPLLQQIVPCLVVVSPDPDVMAQHARVITVVKENGESKIVKGLVS